MICSNVEQDRPLLALNKAEAKVKEYKKKNAAYIIGALVVAIVVAVLYAYGVHSNSS
ncbi:hypothetical protein [Paracoccus sp. (in: a-proteobacteria)]|uniref:hypothetical protein n=1 Tax=Paracoccus sp. TaxID=267 RepID=UPI00396C9EF9